MAISFCRTNENYAEKILRQKQMREIKKEIFRKTIHLCTAFIPLFLDRFYWPIIILLSLVLVTYIICEFLRIKGITVPIISKITDMASRKRDENRFVLGPVTLALGVLITALCFPSMPAKIGILALALGDGLASLFGKVFGHVYIPLTSGKTVAGSLACFVAVYISCFCVCKNVLISFFVALSAMIIEVLPLKDFDNVIIPFVVGGIFLIVKQILVM